MAVRVRTKKISRVSSDDTNILNDMFAQMTGAENADPDVIIPKYVNLNKLINKYVKMYKAMLNFTEFIKSFNEYIDEFSKISIFIENLEKLYDNTISTESLSKMSAQDINDRYKKIKSENEIQSIIVTSGNLGKYKRYIEDKEKLSDDFIKREPGLSMTPLKFTGLDLKLLWCSDKLTKMAKNYLLGILSNTYLIGHEIYTIITSPDIDIKKFSKILIDNIDNMKKQIPRCDKAFDIIANSVTLLENKFDTYYKTSVEASNPSIIIESFIVDVSVSQKTNATITMQFKKIIMFMKKQTANNKDPRVAKLFSILNNQFDMMQMQTGVDASQEPVESEPVESEPIPDLVDI